MPLASSGSRGQCKSGASLCPELALQRVYYRAMGSLYTADKRGLIRDAGSRGTHQG